MASVPAHFLDCRGGYGTPGAMAANSAQFLYQRGGDGADGRRAAAARAHILPKLEKNIIPNSKHRAMLNNQALGKALKLDHSRLVALSAPVDRKRSSVVVAASSVSSQQEKEMDTVKLPISVDYISSPSNAYVKHLVRLRQNPKSRNATSSVLVVGAIPLREICESVEKVGQQWSKVRVNSTFVIDVLLVREDAARAASSEKLGGLSRRVVRVSSDAMSKLSGLDSPPEVAGVLRFPSTFTVFLPNSSLHDQQMMRNWCCNPKPRRILVLDSIQDPGNMGTLLRTAAAFAWDGVFLLHGCCDPFNDKALRSSRGAGFRVPIGVGDWDHVREFAIANELKLFAGDPQSGNGSNDGFSPITPHYVDGELRFPALEDGQGLCLVLGSEGQGLSDHVTKDCVAIGIPMPGDLESLNVAVAGGILMFLLR